MKNKRKIIGMIRQVHIVWTRRKLLSQKGNARQIASGFMSEPIPQMETYGKLRRYM
jgi:hypothetical protein